MNPKVSNNATFLTDFYLAKDPQKNPHMELTKKAAELGFSRFGAEFLFIKPEDLRGLKKQAKQARQIKKELDGLFEKTYFSIHAPWAPVEETALELDNRPLEWLQELLSFCPDFIEVVNVHAGVVPIEYWNKKLAGNFGHKAEHLEKVSEKLASLADFGNRVCVESLYASLDEPFQTSYLTNLPSGLQQLSKPKNVGATIDTAHSGIMIEECKFMVEKQQLLPGFFEEEWKEIQEVAKKGFELYSNPKNKVFHVHFNDFWLEKNQPLENARDGKALGEGNTPLPKLFGWMETLTKNAHKKEIGLTLEIQEKEYTKLENSEKTIQRIADYYGFGN